MAGSVLRGRDEVDPAEPVRDLSGGVFAGEGAGERVPRGETAGGVGAVLARKGAGCHVGLEVLIKMNRYWFVGCFRVGLV